jgi:uncharacterized membrane protein YoaK (UPF0700 family)
VRVPADPDRGRIGLLLAMTALTGLVDATSFLGLGRVFVANMTGNVVFIAFALAGAPGMSAPASLSALAGFLLGALAGSRLGAAFQAGGRRWLVAAITAQCTLIGLALAVTAVTGVAGDARYPVIYALALAMGVQHATARRIATDVPTNVLTTTLTGLVADSRLGGGRGGSYPRRRAAAPAVMFVGALLGAAALLCIGPTASLGGAIGLAAGCLLVAATGQVRPAHPRPAHPRPAHPRPAHPGHR